MVIEGRRERRKEGRKEGRQEGRKEGRKEGREEGRKEGRIHNLFKVWNLDAESLEFWSHESGFLSLQGLRLISQRTILLLFRKIFLPAIGLRPWGINSNVHKWKNFKCFLNFYLITTKHKWSTKGKNFRNFRSSWCRSSPLCTCPRPHPPSA